MNADAELLQLRGRLERERAARKEAERLLEEKARSLFSTNNELLELTRNLEGQVQQRTRELSTALEHAELGMRTQSQFLAMMSHEIRTPLHGILGLLDLLRMGSLDGSQIEQIETIRSTSLVLLRLLNDVLDISKVDAGNFALELEPLNIEEMSRSLVKLYEPLARLKNLKIELENGLTVDGDLIGDESRLRQIISNLINNAIKFTQSGTVSIKVISDPIQEGNTHAFTVSVQDTGIGISEEQKQRLFHQFVQADSSIHKRFGGTGLGLAIAKKLIELMGGEISVCSELGVGSTFEVRLCLEKNQIKRNQAPTQEPIDSRKVPCVPGHFRVLVVDDNPVNRMLLDSFLKRMGATPYLACDGLEAIDSIRKHGEMDLIFMDVIMPNMDGLEATAQIRRTAGGQRTVICGLSANAFKEDQLNCVASGMNAFLSKPLSFDNFCIYMHSVLEPCDLK